MKKLIFILVLSLLTLCGCSKEEVVVYDLVVCDSALSSAADYLKGFETENYVVNVTEFTDEKLNEIFTGLETNSDGLNSVTVYGENLSEEMAVRFVSVAEEIGVDEVKAKRIISRIEQLTEDLEMISKNLRN